VSFAKDSIIAHNSQQAWYLWMCAILGLLTRTSLTVVRSSLRWIRSATWIPQYPRSSQLRFGCYPLAPIRQVTGSHDRLHHRLSVRHRLPEPTHGADWTNAGTAEIKPYRSQGARNGRIERQNPALAKELTEVEQRQYPKWRTRPKPTFYP
jgi:hypothetical protein